MPTMKTVYWQRLSDGRYEVGFSHEEQYEPVKVVADKEAARSWVKAQTVEHKRAVSVLRLIPSTASDGGRVFAYPAAAH